MRGGMQSAGAADSDSATTSGNVKGYGKSAALTLVLTSGQ
jgi:hypothetical protein